MNYSKEENKERFELAALAAGYTDLIWGISSMTTLDTAYIKDKHGYSFPWNPVIHASDAFKLLIDLGIEIKIEDYGITISKFNILPPKNYRITVTIHKDDKDLYQKMKEGIFEVAVGVGKLMKDEARFLNGD
jgi:hypothetical protein